MVRWGTRRALVVRAACWVACWGVLVCGASHSAIADPLAVAKLERSDPVDFARELLPVLRKKCLACHNASDAEGDLVLESADSVKKGGGSGPVVVPGKPDESPLFILARHADEPVMPPEDNDVAAQNMTPVELALLARWITEGAKDGAAAKVVKSIAWQPLPEGNRAIYTVAVDPSGRYAAAGRANQITVYHLGGKRAVLRLTDPGLLKKGLYDKPGVAHLDFVQSLAFHPSGEMLASGGYRTIKLWRRVAAPVVLRHAGNGQAVTAMELLPDRAAVYTGDASGRVRRIIPGKQEASRPWSAHDAPVVALSIALGETRVATAEAKGRVRIWNPQGKRLAEFTSPTPVRGLAWLPGDRLAVAGGKTVAIWQRKDDSDAAWHVGAELKGPGKETTAVLWNAARKEIVVGSLDGTVRIFSVANARQVRSLSHGGPVIGVALRDDGARVVSLGGNKTCVLWDAASGKKLGTLRGDLRHRLALADHEFRTKLAEARVLAAKGDVDRAKNRKAAEEKSKKKTDDDLKKAADELKKKEEALAKPKADREAAEKKLAELKARQTKGKSEMAATAAALKKAQAEKKAADQQAAAALKTLQSAQRTAQQAKAAAEAARKAAAAKKDDANLAKRAEEAAQAATKAEAARKTAETARSMAQKKQQEISARLKSLQDASKKQQADGKKIAAEIKGAEANAKKLAEALRKAEEAVASAKRNVASAKRTAERGTKLLAQAVAGLAQSEKRLKELEGAAKTVRDALEQYNKEAAAGEPQWVSARFAPGGGILVTGSADGRIVVWHAESLAPLEQFSSGAAGSVHVATLSAERFAFSGTPDGVVAEQPYFAPWQLVRTIGDPNDPSLLYDRVTALAFDPSGKRIASGSGDPSRSGQLRVWDVARGEMVQDFVDAHSDMVLDVAFSLEGDRLASSAADRFIKVFDWSTGKMVRAFEGHTGHVLGVSWSGDSRLLASSGADQVVKIWDAAAGDQKRTIAGFKKEATDVHFVGLTNQILLTAGDPVVELRRTDNGGVVRRFSGPSDYVYAAGVDRSGRYFAAGGHDGTLRIWTADGKGVASFDE